MPLRKSMATLRTSCKRRADKENDLSISDSEWNALISEEYGVVFMTVAESGLRYFETTSSITADGSASYLEPSDHLATVGLDRILDAAGRRYELEEIMVQERCQWAGLTGDAVAFTLVDDRIFLYPTPSSGSYELLYIPQPTDISNYEDDDIVDVVTTDGLAMLIWGTAVKALSKSESDVRLAIKERDEAKARLEEWAALRAFNAPRRRFVNDTSPYAEHVYNDPSNFWNRPR